MGGERGKGHNQVRFGGVGGWVHWAAGRRSGHAINTDASAPPCLQPPLLLRAAAFAALLHNKRATHLVSVCCQLLNLLVVICLLVRTPGCVLVVLLFGEVVVVCV